jgi:16S rRNA (uracil1498-N3)-methyltransferase
LLRVLRLEHGDRVEALDGSGKSVLAILAVRGGEAWLEFDGGERTAESRATPLILEAAILKGDAMEWMIEKSAELGVSELVPFTCTRTVVQLDRKGPAAFQQRWQKIADQALKQCGRLDRMIVAEPVTLAELMARPNEGIRFFFDEKSRGPGPEVRPDQSIRILVGPEGGFTDEERALITAAPGAQVASLGPLVLRAETAALAAVSIVTAALRNRTTSA